MNLQSILTNRININQVKQILTLAKQDKTVKNELFRLITDADQRIVYQALWILSHFPYTKNKSSMREYELLKSLALNTSNVGIRRLALTILNKQSQSGEIDIDLYNFCMHRMTLVEESVGIRSLCVKLAYLNSLPNPDLRHELKVVLEMMNDESSPALLVSRNKVLVLLKKNKNQTS